MIRRTRYSKYTKYLVIYHSGAIKFNRSIAEYTYIIYLKFHNDPPTNTELKPPFNRKSRTNRVEIAEITRRRLGLRLFSILCVFFVHFCLFTIFILFFFALNEKFSSSWHCMV